MMSRLRNTAPIALLGIVCVAASYLPVAPIALLAALVAVLLLPAWAAARYAAANGAAGDALESSAYAYGGLALSCWSLWVIGSSIGLSRPLIVAAPVIGAVALTMVGGLQPSPAGPESDSADAGSDSGSSRQRHGARPERFAVILTAVTLAVLVIIPFLPYGWVGSDGVHRMAMTDWYKHLMVTTALDTADRLPPANPFLISDDNTAYYYGFHLVAAAIHRAAGRVGDVYQILLAMTVVTAAAFPLVLFVLARGLLSDSRRATVAAIGGSLLAGFDLVVWALQAVRDTVTAWPLSGGFAGLRAVVPSAHLDFWIHHNERSFSVPYVATIWAPQHVAGVLLALLIIHSLRLPADGRYQLPRGRLLPMVMLAALPAMSAYVAVALVFGAVAIVAVESWSRHCLPWRVESFRRWGSVGVPAALLAIPIIRVLADDAGGRLTFAISSAGTWLNGAAFSTIFGDGSFARLLDTPALYVMEFGIVGIFGLMAIVRRVKGRILTAAQHQAVIMSVAILLLATFVRPPIGEPNNLFARPMLVVWALLACFAADAWCEGGRRRWSRRLGLLVCAGGTALAVVGATLEGAIFWATPRETVAAARWINAETPVGAVVAIDPDRRDLGHWLRRRVIAADRRHALLFGAAPEEYSAAVRRLHDAYDAFDPGEAWALLGSLGAEVVVVDLPAPAWTRPPCFTPGYRGERLAVFLRTTAPCTTHVRSAYER